MAEPSRSDPVEHLSNFVRTTPSFVSHREELIPLYLSLAQTLPFCWTSLPWRANDFSSRMYRIERSSSIRQGLPAAAIKMYGPVSPIMKKLSRCIVLSVTSEGWRRF